MANSYPKATILALCQKYGVRLHPPGGADGVALMEAIASNESSLGADCSPRYEHAYDRGGRYDEGDQATLLDQFGKAAACSYGPWQVMAVNALPFTPPELVDDPDACARAFVAYFNSYVVKIHKASDIEQVGQVYNSGHISIAPAPGVQAYSRRLAEAYIRAQAGGHEDALSIA